MPSQTHSELPPPAVEEPGTPTLMVIHAPNPQRIGDRLGLEAEKETVIGREAPHFASEALMDPQVSGKHLRVRASACGLVFEDLDSKNGSYLDADRVKQGVLQPGDAIQIGSCFLSYHLESGLPETDAESWIDGISNSSRRLRKSLGAASLHSRPLLLSGPPGVGKERAAREVHRLSRPKAPWLVANCSTLSPDLSEAELLGSTLGALTDDTAQQMGLPQAVAGGTLFLDEICTLPLNLQSTLLGALQESCQRSTEAARRALYRPRLICASDKDLAAAVAAGQFSADLWSALSGARVMVPSLAERQEDLSILSQAILTAHDAEQVRLSATLVWALRRHPWPLNVQSLEQCLLANLHDSSNNVLTLSTTLESYLDRIASSETVALEHPESGTFSPEGEN